jgi:cytochrome c oxidase assembly protein subunit 15
MSKAPDNIGLHRYAVITAVSTFCLIIAGALVTSNDAGLSVPDWPLSYGKLMPPMVGGIFYEHGHRMIAGGVGLLTIGLVAWLFRSEPRRWVRHLGVAALAAVVLQGFLGGITVLLYLPPVISIAHASLAQFFFCCAVGLAIVTSPKWRQSEGQGLAESALSDRIPLFHLAAGAAAAVYLQLILGAAIRHPILGVLPHVFFAGVVASVGFAAAFRALKHHADRTELRRPALALGVLLFIQMILGTGSYLAKYARQDAQPLPFTIVITTAHVACGALILAAALSLALWSRRLLGALGRPVPVLAPVAEGSAKC